MTPDTPLVSIITPVYNGAYTIRRTIESIREQDYPRIEHIVMDAGSTDGTLDILRSYADRLTWFSEPDKGQSDALNTGFARATGSYLTWLNADDVLRPGGISRCLQVFTENPDVALVFGRLDWIDRDGNYLKDDHNVRDGTYEDLMRGDNFISQSGNLFTREAWETCGPLDINLHYCMDVDLWIKIMQRYPIKYTPQVFAALGVYPETKSAAGGLPRFEEIRQMIESHGGGASSTYYKIGLWYYQHNQMREARRHFQIALARDPNPIIQRRLLSLTLKSYLGGPVVTLGRTLRSQLTHK
ncbi:MAG: glycosyltransferase [Chloroflexota bacterium]